LLESMSLVAAAQMTRCRRLLFAPSASSINATRGSFLAQLYTSLRASIVMMPRFTRMHPEQFVRQEYPE
jgi:hypothetical protein